MISYGRNIASRKPVSTETVKPVVVAPTLATDATPYRPRQKTLPVTTRPQSPPIPVKSTGSIQDIFNEQVEPVLAKIRTNPDYVIGFRVAGETQDTLRMSLYALHKSTGKEVRMEFESRANDTFSIQNQGNTSNMPLSALPQAFTQTRENILALIAT